MDTIVKKRLFELQDTGYREFHSRLMPTVQKDKIIGVRVPVLRALAKELAGEEGIDEFLNTLPHTYYEEDNLHAFLIEKIKDYDACMDALWKFLPYVDNWATCDMMRPKCFKNNKCELLAEIKKMLNSNYVYTVRYGIGMLMCHFLKEDFRTEYLQMTASASCNEYYINMMVAWYFAEALLWQYDETVKFMEEKRLPKWVHNKAIQKANESFRITKEKKEYLKSLKI